MTFLGDVCEAVRHARTIRNEIRRCQSMDSSELYTYAKELRVPYDLLKKTAEIGRLPVVNFAAGGLGKLILFTEIPAVYSIEDRSAVLEQHHCLTAASERSLMHKILENCISFELLYQGRSLF